MRQHFGMLNNMRSRMGGGWAGRQMGSMPGMQDGLTHMQAMMRNMGLGMGRQGEGWQRLSPIGEMAGPMGFQLNTGNRSVDMPSIPASVLRTPGSLNAMGLGRSKFDY